MEFGNKYLGGDLNKDYASIFIVPFGIEVFAYNEMENRIRQTNCIRRAC